MANTRLMAILGASLIMVFAGHAKAQTGWFATIYPKGESRASLENLPVINQPKPEWAKVADIQSTDGTAIVPSCGEPDVVATVRADIIAVLNKQFQSIQISSGLGALFHRIDMAPVWVHPTFSGSYVCDTVITLPEMPEIDPNHWKFQTFAQDGKMRVFFYDVEEQH